MAPGLKGVEPWIIRISRVVFSLAVFWIPLLPVVFADEFPEFTQQPESRIVSQDAPVTLNCSATPADVHIRWLYNGRPLDERRHQGLRVEGSNLVFQHIGLTTRIGPREGGVASGSGAIAKFPGNAGVYRCTATNDVGTIISIPAKLSTPVMQDFQHPSAQVQMRLPIGGYVTLTCDTPNSLPPAKVIFVKDTDQIVDSQRDDAQVLPSGNIVLSRLTPSASGDYRCIAINPVSGENRTSPSAISVQVDSRVKDDSPSTHVLTMDRVRRVQVPIGSDVILECPSYGQNWDGITWSKYGGSLPMGRWQTTQFGNLRIYRTHRHDNGTYKCATSGPSSSASASVPIQEARVFLEIFESPAIQVSSRPGTIEEGKKVEMRCDVIRGYPMPNLTWFHNGREVARYSTGKGEDGTFVLPQASKADSGIYQCMATNQLGTSSGTLELVILGHPSPIDDDIGEELPVLEDMDEIDDLELDDKDKSTRRDRKKSGRRKKMRMRERRKKKKGEKEKPKYAPSVPTVTQLSDRTVMLNWTVPDRDNGQTIIFFKVQFKEMSPKKGIWQTSDAHLPSDTRIFEVGGLKAGGSYKFRVFAVYEDDDNRNSENTQLFKLSLQEHLQPRVPDTKPIIVEATSVFFQDKFGIGIKWQYKAETASPIEGFVLLYKIYGTKKDQELVLPGANIRNHVIIDLEPDTYYSIRMQSFNMAGRSAVSNQVVESTKSRGKSGLAVDYPPEPDEVPSIDPTDTPTSGRHSSNTNLEEPVILGIVLGALLLALVVLVSMCWWKQHQQKRRNLASESQKFQDQSHCIYSDALPPQHNKPNGGLYPHMGNGHGPPHETGRAGGMNIDVNPLAEYDLQTAVHPPDGRGKQFYGNGIGSENGGRYRDSGEMMYMEDSLQQQQQQQQSVKPGHSIQHRSLPSAPNSPLSSFYSPISSQSHEYSEPTDQREFPKSPSGHSYPMNSQGISHSMSASYKHNPPYPPPHPHHPSLVGGGHPRGYGYDWSGSYEHAHGGDNPHLGRHTPLNFRGGQDFENNPLLMYQQSQQPARYPVQPPPPTLHSSNNNGVRAPVPPLYYKTVPIDYAQKQSGLQQANGRHKKRKKRQHGRERSPYFKETAGVRDQATNTDLSSNEGTIEFTSFGKSGSSSNSVSNYGSDTGCIGGGDGVNPNHNHNRDSSFANNGSLESEDNESVSVASETSRDYDVRHSADYSLPL